MRPHSLDQPRKRRLPTTAPRLSQRTGRDSRRVQAFERTPGVRDSRPTLLYAHHDRGSAASMVIVVLVNMNEGGRAVMMDGGPCDLRCCMGDGGWLALQSRLAEEGSKPRQGALAEDRRLERCRKGAA